LDDQSIHVDRTSQLHLEQELHFCNEQGAWRYLIPALLDLPQPDFNWDVCRFPQGFSMGHCLLESSCFSFVPTGLEEYVTQWIEIYGLDNLTQKISIHWWGEAVLSLPSTQLPRHDSVTNGFILDLISKYPLLSLRALLVERGMHPIDRLKLRQVLDSSGDLLRGLGWKVPVLPNQYKLRFHHP
jgi:hypothetical protein